MNQTPKILIGTPVFEGMRYCLDEFLESIKNLDYNNFDILLVDNSEGNSFFNELSKKEGAIVIKDDNIDKQKLKRIISSRNKILNYALNNNYDYVLMMDVDVIPPINIIKELLSLNKFIVSGIYDNYFKYSGKIVLLPCAFKYLSEEEFEDLKKNYNSSAKSRFELKRHLSEEEVSTGNIFKVIYCSGGCMLIKKDVFEKFKYDFKENCTDEISFLDDSLKAGFQPYCYTKIKCKHLIQGKFIRDEKGDFYHPLHF